MLGLEGLGREIRLVCSTQRKDGRENRNRDKIKRMRAIAVQVNPFENIKYDEPLPNILEGYWPNMPSAYFLSEFRMEQAHKL